VRPTLRHAAALLATALALGAGPAAAQGPAGDDPAAALVSRLAADFGLDGGESDALLKPVRAHLAQGGREQTLRALLGAAVEAGCRDTCPAAAVKAMNRARAAGMPFMDALRLVRADLAGALAAGGPEGGPPSTAELAEAVRARMDARLGSWHPPADTVAPAAAPPQPPASQWPPKRPRLP